MSNTTILKSRIKSVKNTKQITKAMELVAASKMKKAQEHAVSSRDYRRAAKSILSRLSGVSDVSRHPLFAKRKVRTKLIVVITSDRGLAGAYNSNAFKLLARKVSDDKKKNINVEVVAIGRQAAHFLPRIKEIKTIAVYPMFTTKPTESEIRNMANPIFKKFLAEEIDAVEVIYTHFISNISQQAQSITLLPEDLNGDKPDISELEVAIFEPNIEDIVEDVTRRLLQVQLWQALLESLASEHSMRMMAMKNATDNANEIIDDLTLAYNTARQAAITQEIAEIVGGAEAVSQK
jgi:F-type H+-transporting ATPase subunit gamma